MRIGGIPLSLSRYLQVTTLAQSPWTDRKTPAKDPIGQVRWPPCCRRRCFDWVGVPRISLIALTLENAEFSCGLQK
mgnify:CR=1 FL=1